MQLHTLCNHLSMREGLYNTYPGPTAYICAASSNPVQCISSAQHPSMSSIPPSFPVQVAPLHPLLPPSLQVIHHLKDAALQPIIVFSFSRRDCEQYSIAVGSPERGQLCFTTAEEQEAIEEVGGGGVRVPGLPHVHPPGCSVHNSLHSTPRCFGCTCVHSGSIEAE